MTRRTLGVLIVLCALVSTVGVDARAQDGGHVHGAPVAAVKAELAIGGDVAKPVTLTLAELEKLPRRKVRAKAHNGTMVDYEGVSLDVVLGQGGVVFGDSMRGNALTAYLVAQGADKYRAVFAIPEIDPSFTNSVIVVAFLADGKPLAEGNGPFQMIVPDDRRHGRWVRQVVSLTMQKLPE